MTRPGQGEASIDGCLQIQAAVLEVKKQVGSGKGLADALKAVKKTQKEPATGKVLNCLLGMYLLGLEWLSWPAHDWR